MDATNSVYLTARRLFACVGGRLMGEILRAITKSAIKTHACMHI